MVARIQPGQSLLSAIEELLKKHEIKSGYIPVIHGCFSDCTILTVEENPDCPGDPKDVEISFDEPLVYSGNGTIAEEEDGKPFIHLHPTISKKDGIAYVGHLIEATVLLTTEIVIVEVLGMKINRKPAPEVHDIILLNVE